MRTRTPGIATPGWTTFVCVVLLAASGVWGPGAAAAQQEEIQGPAAAQDATPDTAIFAGGCFWCMEPPYEELEGVRSVTAGFAGGHVADPTYDQVSRGTTGHREVVRVIYDPTRVEYERLLDIYWRNIDPLDAGGQFCDRGHQYTSAIYATTDRQERLAEASKREVAGRFEEPVVTPVERDATFYPAGEDHQDYYREHTLRYEFYKWRCGREDRLEEVWG